MEPALRRRCDTLYWLTFDINERCAQRLVAGDDPVQRPPQGFAIKLPLQPPSVKNVIGLARSYLRQQPQPLLRKRQRQSLRTSRRSDLRQLTGPIVFTTEPLRQKQLPGRRKLCLPL